ncbi:hypothetical protein MMC32_002044 [Xylographa parallela]|nr:hypothetical protein [Xylographa parallela]
MARFLPDDVLLMISDQLWYQKDFGTLFNLCISCKQLALPAIAYLYRMHNVKLGGSDEVEVAARQGKPGDGNAQQNQAVSRWVHLWKTIILSSLGKTTYLYCRYIRALDLRDLKDLLEDEMFRADFGNDFFSGELSQFRKEMDTPVKAKSRTKRPLRLNIIATLEAIGEAITQQTPVLEELHGEITSAALLRWIPRLPKLQQITLWNGAALANGVGSTLHIHCPDFKILRFYTWTSPDTDHFFAAFLQDLRPQSLESLEVISYSDIGAKTFLALNRHSKSLLDLKLDNITPEAMPGLSMLKECTALGSLLLAETIGSTDLEHTQNDIFLEVIGWLRECKSLQNITFHKFLSGPALLTPILLESNIHLVRLEVTDYAASKAKDFHQALARQQSLRSLVLKSDGEVCDINALVFSLCKIVHLVDLRLSNVSDFFRDEHICLLASNLPELETLWISGWGITDQIWSYLKLLHSLRRLDINAWSSFTADGLLEYISGLGEGNRGLFLAVMMADPDSALSEREQYIVQEALTMKVEGRFDYTLARGKHSYSSYKDDSKVQTDPDAEEFNESDSE